MTIYVGIDDTDNLQSRGTGHLVRTLAEELRAAGLGTPLSVTRHQLLVHPDIPYTSHNSSMCFPAEIGDEDLEALTAWCQASLAAESVEAADPGLCVVAVDRLERPAVLVEYGREAKRRVFAKEEAYRLAEELGVHLSEHGGTGIGVIGALAGAGLRLSGEDGRFKGKFRLEGDEDGTVSVAGVKRQAVDEVRTLDGLTLADDERVLAAEECKLVLLGGRAVLLVTPAMADAAAPWQTVERRALRSYRAMAKLEHGSSGIRFVGSVDSDGDVGEAAIIASACDAYRVDVDDEDPLGGEGNCFSCRYRRWVPGGFSCMKTLLPAEMPSAD